MKTKKLVEGFIETLSKMQASQMTELLKNKSCINVPMDTDDEKGTKKPEKKIESDKKKKKKVASDKKLKNSVPESDKKKEKKCATDKKPEQKSNVKVMQLVGAESGEKKVMPEAEESGEMKKSEDRSRQKSKKPSKVTLVKDVKEGKIVMPIKKKKKEKSSLSPVKAQNVQECSSSDDAENPIAKAFKRLDWSKIIPESTRCYTIYVGK